MKSYDETIASVFAKGDAIIAEKKHRMAVIRRFSLSASGVCAVLLISIGIWKNSALNTPPEKDAGKEQSGIIAETTDIHTVLTTAAVHETTLVNTTKSTSCTASASTAADTSSGTTSIVTTAEAVISDAEIQTAPQTSLTTVTQTSTVSASDTVTETQTTAETNEITTVHTTATASIQESGEEIAFVTTTKAEIIPVTKQTTSPCSVTDIESYPVQTSIRYDSLETENSGTTYIAAAHSELSDAKKRNAGIGTLHGVIIPSFEKTDVSARVWRINNISPLFALAAKDTDSKIYTVFLNEKYSCQTFGELLTDIDAENELQIRNVQYRYKGRKRNSTADATYIIELLAGLSDAPCVPPETAELSDVCVTVVFDMPLIGAYNSDIYVTENGYIATHFIPSGQYFYIGMDKAAELVDALR